MRLILATCGTGAVLQSGVMARPGTVACTRLLSARQRIACELEASGAVTIETLGRGWFSECGMVALLLLALVTSGVATFQVRELLRRRSNSFSDERRVAPLWPLMTVALALAFWLMLAAVWLFQGIEGESGAPWWR